MAIYYVNPDEHDDDECALCGQTDNLEELVVLSEAVLSDIVLVGCEECVEKLEEKVLERVLVLMCEEEDERWDNILEYQQEQSTNLSKLISAINRGDDFGEIDFGHYNESNQPDLALLPEFNTDYLAHINSPEPPIDEIQEGRV